MFDPASGYKVSVYDAPIYIADAAVVLMKTKPELSIKNPYALDDTQFAAAVDLLKPAEAGDHPVLGRLPQADGRLPQRQRERRDDLADHHQPAPGRDAAGHGRGHQADEGATGWSDTWMINSKTKNLTCAYSSSTT